MQGNSNLCPHTFVFRTIGSASTQWSTLHSVLLMILMATVLLSFGSCTTGKSFEISLDGEWLFNVDSLNVGMREQWYIRGSDRSAWKPMKVPDHWDRYKLSAYDGVAWYAKTFQLDSVGSWSLVFFGVDDDADVWVNGLKVGSHEGNREAFYFDVSQLAAVGKNEVVVRVNDRGGAGGIYKPVAIVRSDRVEAYMRSEFADMQARPSADWARNAVIYEVFLRSFSKEGTIKAFERRVPELKELGVTVLSLMPIHPVGELNRKGTRGSPYAIQDYYEIDPDYGTMDDFRSLVKTAHENGMRIILELVAKHTAWDSKILMEHPEWFTKDEKGNIVSPHADWTDVADLNYENHELRKYMIEMMKYWVRDVGVDGFRCSASELVPTNFWEIVRRELDKIRPVMMISEGTLPEYHLVAFDLTASWNLYAALGKVVHGQASVKVFDDILKYEGYQFPRGSLRMRFSSNHEKVSWEAPAPEQYGIDEAKAVAVLIFVYPGVPMIYNGEEVGNNRRLDLYEKVDIDWRMNSDYREFYRKLCFLRREHGALTEGEYIPLPNSDAQKVYSFARRKAGDVVVALLNLSDTPREVESPIPTDGGSVFVDFFSKETLRVKEGRARIQMKPWAYKVFTSVPPVKISSFQGSKGHGQEK